MFASNLFLVCSGPHDIVDIKVSPEGAKENKNVEGDDKERSQSAKDTKRNDNALIFDEDSSSGRFTG